MNNPIYTLFIAALTADKELMDELAEDPEEIDEEVSKRILGLLHNEYFVESLQAILDGQLLEQILKDIDKIGYTGRFQ